MLLRLTSVLHAITMFPTKCSSAQETNGTTLCHKLDTCEVMFKMPKSNDATAYSICHWTDALSPFLIAFVLCLTGHAG